MTRGGLCVKLKNFAGAPLQPRPAVVSDEACRAQGLGPVRAHFLGRCALPASSMQWTESSPSTARRRSCRTPTWAIRARLTAVTRRRTTFFNRLGSHQWPRRPIASPELVDRLIMTVGPTGGLDVESLAFSKYIIVWGMNMLNTNPYAWPFILRPRRRAQRSW